MTTTHTNEELMLMAGKQNADRVVGRNREADGVVPGWHTWAARHAQKEDSIVICGGREEWRQRRTTQKDELSVVSWNILSNTWWVRGKGEGEYDHTPQAEGDWTFRLQRLLQWMEELNPDVLAVQELDYDKFEVDIMPELQKRGYNGLMQRPKNLAEQQPCGNATFWKSARFEVSKHASFSRTLCTVLEQIEEGNKTQLCMVNVHLEASQSDKGCDNRARQMNSALAYAASKAPGASVLVCGDCNTGADSELFRVLREHEWHGHSFSSVYEHPNTYRTLPVSVATFMCPGHHYVIDHMFYARDSLRLRCALDAFSKKEMEEHVYPKGDDCGFPSAFLPSDHLPIGAVFEVLPQEQRQQPEQCAPTLTAERQAELKRQWESLLVGRPPKQKSEPNEEELVALRKFKAEVNAWKETLKDDALGLKFARKLEKAGK